MTLIFTIITFTIVIFTIVIFTKDTLAQEEKKLTPGERIQMACELSDVCALLNQSARKTLEEKRAYLVNKLCEAGMNAELRRGGFDDPVPLLN